MCDSDYINGLQLNFSVTVSLQSHFYSLNPDLFNFLSYSSFLRCTSPFFLLAWSVCVSIDSLYHSNFQTIEQVSILMDLFDIFYCCFASDPAPVPLYHSSGPGDYGTSMKFPMYYPSDDYHRDVRPLASTVTSPQAH